MKNELLFAALSQLMALRTQMNPHFVFNCLNSIQECIVTEKYPEAITYLNKFSKLFRSILNNSSRVFVSLRDEIEVLDLYLLLEHMRFEKSFEYNLMRWNPVAVFNTNSKTFIFTRSFC